MKKIHHYDSSVLIPYINARLGLQAKDARGTEKNKRAHVFVTGSRVLARISVATYAETTRHFKEDESAAKLLAEFGTPLQLTQRNARRWSRLQNRSGRVMGDNDAWNAALAIDENAVLVGSDHAFKNRPDLDYIDFMNP